jgi:hypothetical protein
MPGCHCVMSTTDYDVNSTRLVTSMQAPVQATSDDTKMTIGLCSKVHQLLRLSGAKRSYER